MLLRFVVSNFKSFAEEVDFNLLPYERLKSHKHHVYEAPGVNLLKAAAVYGANGAGKSNLVEAFKYLQLAVVSDTFDYPYLGHRLKPELQDGPMHFELEFLYENQFYAYLLEVDQKGILEECLYKIHPPSTRQDILFERTRRSDGKIVLSIDESIANTERDRLLVQVYSQEILTSHIPFLRQISERQHFSEIGDVFNFFTDHLLLVFPNSRLPVLTQLFMDDNHFIRTVNNIFSELDTGVRHLELRSTTFEEYYGIEDRGLRPLLLQEFEDDDDYVVHPDEEDDVIITKDANGNLYTHRIVLIHQGEQGELHEFEINDESDGTKRILELLPFMISLYYPGQIVIIDEIGRSLHHNLLKELSRLMMKHSLAGQLIFTTHDANLLDLSIFRQDEIWFVDKDRTGASRAYPMSDFKPRHDLDVRKGYLNGRFGGVPALDQLENMQLELDYATPK